MLSHLMNLESKVKNAKFFIFSHDFVSFLSLSVTLKAESIEVQLNIEKKTAVWDQGHKKTVKPHHPTLRLFLSDLVFRLRHIFLWTELSHMSWVISTCLKEKHTTLVWSFIRSSLCAPDGITAIIALDPVMLGWVASLASDSMADQRVKGRLLAY